MRTSEELLIVLTEGRVFATARRTLTEADIVNYAGLSNDFNPLHVDEVHAAATEFGRRIAHGQLVASIVTGLRSELDEWPVLAYLGTARRFSAAVGAGDTIHAVYRVASLRPSRSRPGQSVATLAVKVFDQGGTEVMSGEDTMLLGAWEPAHDGVG